MSKKKHYLITDLKKADKIYKNMKKKWTDDESKTIQTLGLLYFVWGCLRTFSLVLAVYVLYISVESFYYGVMSQSHLVTAVSFFGFLLGGWVLRNSMDDFRRLIYK